MKVRWREHEITFVTILVIWKIASLLTGADALHHTEYVRKLAETFGRGGVEFSFEKNFLYPQLALVLLLYFGYLALTLLLLPLIKRITFGDFERWLTLRILWPVLLGLALAFLLALGANTITYFGRPAYVNYWEYSNLAVFGYNEYPLSNLLFGFSRSVVLVASFTALFGVRELLIWLLQKTTNRNFNIMVANNSTTLFFSYLLILVFMDPIHVSFMKQVVFVMPLLPFYLYLTFWFFPYAEGKLISKEAAARYIPAWIAVILLAILSAQRGDAFVVISYILGVALVFTPLTWLLYVQRRASILHLKNIEKAGAQSNADLQLLRAQINPHFLFNILNTLYGTALQEKAEATAEGIQKLGDMMRFMLHENHSDFIAMESEIRYLENYIDLQKLRIQHSPDITIEVQLPEHKCPHSIAPMILIPFVENAFKHGISLRQKSWINIMLECREDLLVFEVANSVHGHLAEDFENGKSGIGLQNVRQRLALIYPSHVLHITSDEKEYRTKLIINQNPNEHA